MEEQITSQQPNQKQGFKSILIVIIAVALTALIVGASVYFLQNSKLNLSEQESRQENTELQKQLTQLQSEYETLKVSMSEAKNTNSAGYELINNYCSTDECLFNIGNSNYPLGSTVIKGYYSPVERSAWDETKKCDSFTITDGPVELTRAMIDLVDGGNTVHSKNKLNQPVINLGLDLLSQAEKQSILNSTENNQVELIVLSDSPRESGVPVCYQDVIVLRKK